MPSVRPAPVGLAALATASVPLLLLAPAASAAGERPSAYVNADKGMATENPNVSASSECETPVRSDTQPLGDEASGKGNVHVDACLFDGGGMRVDTPAAFTVSGVGVISGCPDPDKEGPESATKTGSSCVLSSFEAANSEYHVRVVSATAGQQTVDFCADPEGDGCGNAESVSTVRIAWGAPTGGAATGGSTGSAPAAPGAVALVAVVTAAGAVAVGMRGSLARR